MDSLSINVLDMVAVAVLILSAILAFFRGFVHEVLSIAAWIGAGLAALYGLPLARPKAHELIPIPVAADAAAAIVIFLVALLILSLITRALSKQVQGSGLNSLDRSLGFLFGLLRGAVILSLAYVVMSWAIPDAKARPDWINNARSTPLMASGGDLLRSLVPASLLAEEDTARAKAQEAKETARQAMKLKETYDQLKQPRPDADYSGSASSNSSSGSSTSVTSTPANSAATSSGSNSSSQAGSYSDSTREGLDDLVNSQK